MSAAWENKVKWQSLLKRAKFKDIILMDYKL